jgi:AbrB family looped-hinge helix DNA binding protein
MVLLSYKSKESGDVESAITVKGQATIPKAIQEHLQLKAGDKVKCFIHPDGTVVLLPKRGRVTIERMNQTIAQAAARSPRRRR